MLAKPNAAVIVIRVLCITHILLKTSQLSLSTFSFQTPPYIRVLQVPIISFRSLGVYTASVAAKQKSSTNLSYNSLYLFFLFLFSSDNCVPFSAVG
jgi:hypothetical protein